MRKMTIENNQTRALDRWGDVACSEEELRRDLLSSQEDLATMSQRIPWRAQATRRDTRFPQLGGLFRARCPRAMEIRRLIEKR